MAPAKYKRGTQWVCEKCSYITSLNTNDLRRLLPSTPPSALAESYRAREQWPPQFRYTNAEFLLGLESACWVCTAVHQRFKWPGKGSNLRCLGPNYEFCRVNWARQRIVSQDENYEHDLTFHFAGQEFSSDTPEYLVVSLQETATELDYLARKSLSQHWTGHQDVADLGRAWLSNCLSSHPSCRALDTGWMPSRLLDVSATCIRLVSRERLVDKEPYATLSHCWGSEPFETLTHATYAKFCSGILAETFLPTFRDAIVTVQRFGIRYIWIDCFCILQDDAADWETQATEMKSVYENSMLNIGGATSEGPHGGLFTERTCSDVHSVVVERRTLSTGSNIGSSGRNIVTHENRPSTLHEALESLNATRLMSRAWVLQECALSPRMLSFCAREMVWQCSQTLLCESVPGNASGHLPPDVKHHFWALGVPGEHPPPVAPGQAEDVRLRKKDISARKRWFDVLHTYLGCSLTYPSKDILKAIEGVGQRSARLGRTIYRNGILESTLPLALGFSVDPKSPAQVEMPSLAFEGPTWHWATHKARGMRPGSIDYNSPLRDAWCNLPLAYAFMSTSCGLVPPLTEDTDLWPHMLCIGRLLRAQCLTRTDRPSPEPLIIISAEGPNSPSSSFEISASGLRFDKVSKMRAHRTFYLLPLLTELRGGLGGSTSGFEFLVLNKSGRGTYSRAGVFASFESIDRWQQAIRQARPLLVDME